MGRAGWAASVTAISPAGLWRAPLGPRRVDARALGATPAPARLAGAARRAAAASAMLATFAAQPDVSPPTPGASSSWAGSTPTATTAPTGRCAPTSSTPPATPDVPVTLAWGELDRLVAPPRPERRPAGARYLVLPGSATPRRGTTPS